MNLLLDNSAIKLLSCERKFQLRVVQGLTVPPNDILQFGSAFHVLLEDTDKGSTFDDALEDAVAKGFEGNKTKLETIYRLFRASVELPAPIVCSDGKPAIERKFHNYYGSFDNIAKTHYQVSEEARETSPELVHLYLTGTIDRIHIDPATDTLVILDYKTATDFSASSIANKIKDAALDFQLPFYVYNLLKSGLLPADMEHYITEHKYRIEVLYTFYNSAPPCFKRYIHSAFNDEFLKTTVPRIIDNAAARAISITNLPQNQPALYTGLHTYKACTYCDYRPACLHMGTQKELDILENYDKKPYDPSTFR